MTASVPSLIALIPAAGGSRRFGGPRPKQYMPLHGKTVIECTLQRLYCGLMPSRIVVVIAPDDADFQALTHLPPNVEVWPCGGVTRAESVYNGLRALRETCHDDDWIAVHDAARPCVPMNCLRTLAELARRSGTGDDGAVLALPLTDTLKEGVIDENDVARVLVTHDRARFWSAQTPQMFRLRTLLAALSADGALLCTDEAQAVERHCVHGGAALSRLVRGSVQNLKVTYPEDLALAEAILTFQENDGP